MKEKCFVENLVRKSIKAFLLANETAFFSQIVHFDRQRGFNHITTSGVNPARDYYYAVIMVDEVELVSRSPVGINDITGLPRQRQYKVTIGLVDYLYGVMGESQLYETMDESFQVVTDRILFAIEDEGLTFTYDNHRFMVVPDSQIQKINRQADWTVSEVHHAVREAEITFNVYGC